MTSSSIEAVTQLVLRERQSRDRGWWDEMAACYAEESVVDISWIKGSGAEFVRRTIEASKDGVWGRHRLSPPTVRVNGERAWAEVPLAIEFRFDVDGVEADLISYARSQYRCVLAGGEWRIVRLETIYERDTLTPSVPGTHLDLRPEDFTSQRPALRCLAWDLVRDGKTVGSDMPGDDRPETVRRVYDEISQWLAAAGETQR